MLLDRPLTQPHPSHVSWTDGFWAERFAICRDAMVPNMWRLLDDDALCHAFANFRIAAGREEGRHRGPRWHDGDLYKWLEAAASVLAQSPDDRLDALLDRVIDTIAAAQCDDGYLHTPVIIARDRLGGDARPFQDPEGFEMYNFGHLMSAAAAHVRATGKSALLAVAERAADFMRAAFVVPTRELAHHTVCPSHYMGAIELFRLTGDSNWLELPELWLEARDLLRDGTDDNQTRVPVREQRVAVGHAVRANYLYAGLTDVCAEQGDAEFLDTIAAVWDDVFARKLYITGACGALYDGASPDGAQDQSTIARVHQAYGRPYQLPNLTAYGETCANLGFAFWSARMVHATAEARYADAVETVLYNSGLASISLDGTRFFYTNPLRRLDDPPFDLRWSRTREPYISCFCCPPNIVRTVASTNRLAYASSDDGLCVLLYGGSRWEASVSNAPVTLTQETDYPWSGDVRLRVDPSTSLSFTLKLRIPAWTDGATVTINGVPLSGETEPGAFLDITRTWSPGDVVELTLPMPVRLLEAHPLVEENRNQVAVTRGPIVYCLESTDLPDGVRLADVRMSPDVVLTPRHDPGLLHGVTVLEGVAYRATSAGWGDRLYRPVTPAATEPVPIRLVPYYAWDNRGASEMSVWLPLSVGHPA